MPSEAYSDDVIVIKKTWVTTAAVALVFFIAGGLAGYFFGVFAYNRGAEAAGGNPQAEVAVTPQPQQQPPTELPARLDDVSVDDDPVMGNEDAPVVIVEFSDFQCSYCARFYQDTLPQLFEEYGDDIQFVYRDYPLSPIHPHAQEAAEAAECANDQDAFWEYHDLLFDNQTALDTESLISYAEELELDTDEFTDCLESGKYTDEVLADFEEGRSYGVSGTPTFFINGVRLVGAQPFANFQQVIEAELGS